METRLINLGEGQALSDQFRFRHSPDWTFETFNIKLFTTMNKTMY